MNPNNVIAIAIAGTRLTKINAYLTLAKVKSKEEILNLAGV